MNVTIRIVLCLGCVCCLVGGAEFVSATGAQSNPAENAVLKIGTMDLPPYGWIDKQGNKQGIIYALGQEIGIRSGIPFTNEIYPFNRLLKMLKNGEIDLLSSQAHQPALDAGDKLGILFEINVIAVTKKGSGIRKIEDFKNKFLLYHHSATYPQLKGLPREIQRVKSYRQVLDLLYTRANVDGGVFSEPAYYYWLHELGLSSKDFGRVVLIEKDKKQWVFVRKDLPKSLRKRLQKVVESIYQENLYEQFLNKYNLNY